MRLATLGTYWGDRLAALVDDELVDLSAAFALRLTRTEGLRRDRAIRLAALALPSEMNDFLLAGPPAWEHARDVVDWAGDAITRDRESLRTCTWRLDAAPITAACPRPPKVWCMGANYLQHRVEMAARRGEQANLAQTMQGFIKSPTAVIGPFDQIVYPPEAQHVDYEMELAVVIGTGGRRIAEAQAMDHVFGYTVLNDVSCRDVAALDNGRMDRGKGFDTFAVVGPWVVTRDEVPDPHDLHLTLRLNGELRQDTSTEDMAHRIPAQIAWLSQAMTLEPGDLISTGTPSGVGPIKPGDLIEGEVEGIGKIRNQVVAEITAPRPR
jgi:2-keto-4-pentenoate hydratase/2-oxohepta-3-ene-1,7-dioic acid hydratase in catechol pathway